MNKMKINIPMFAALILLLLTMITTHMTSGLYARYTSHASGSASARVARFAVTGVVTPVEDENGKYTLVVINDSEVTVHYNIIVEVDNHLSVTLGGVTKTPVLGSVTFENDDWKLAPGASTENPMLMTIDVADWTNITQSDKNFGATEPVTFTFTVKVDAEQVD